MLLVVCQVEFRGFQMLGFYIFTPGWQCSCHRHPDGANAHGGALSINRNRGGTDCVGGSPALAASVSEHHRDRREHHRESRGSG